MKINCLLILCFSLVLFRVDAQQELHYKKVDQEYRNQKLDYDSLYFDLTPVNKSVYNQHIRIYISGSTIDLFQDETGSYKGFVVSEITQYSNVKEKDEKFGSNVADFAISDKVLLDSLLVKHAMQTIIASGIHDLPTDTLIPGWNDRFLHCNGIVFKYSFAGKYKSQEFQCPWGQHDSLPAKLIVVNNYELIEKTFKLDSLHDVLTGKLPGGKTYSVDGYRMLYILTAEQSEKWKRGQPRRDYMKSVKDTIDNYLALILTNSKLDRKKFDCFQDYHLIFGKNGKLWKVSVSEYNKPKLFDGLVWYLEDKREIRKCKAEIRKILKPIDLSFVKLQSKVYRTLMFSLEGDVSVIDRTIY